MRIKNMFTLLKVFMTVITQVIAFAWIEDNDHFDCIAGIALHGTPIATGVFVSWKVVLTSANSLEHHKRQWGHIHVYEVFDTHIKQRHRQPLRFIYDISKRKSVWISMGYNDSSHSSIHDIILIQLAEFLPYQDRNKTTYYLRTFYPVPIATWKSSFPSVSGWSFAGFGFVDENHVSDNINLELEYLESDTQTDCDAWIPREWGHFLCFYDYNNLAGVASGVPLFPVYNYIPKRTPVYGIGSFSLTKGNDSILVFTDLRPYTNVFRIFSRHLQFLVLDGISPHGFA